ncbi:hypothetical protein QJS10_CPB14g01315 [Acorus calamus]|uniref:Uncharacterized protein n=1 Tax=Acorus calamus TaxID=4465 RepID=A0AAV9DBQ2_ACOCL|nr:hypothetical protein QJS10_CPB14g01315 [Acorus calamus]
MIPTKDFKSLKRRCLEQPFSNLGGDVAHSPGAVRDEDGRGLRGGTDLLHRVEVLGDQYHVHDVLRCCAGHILGEPEHTVPEAIHDRLALERYLDSASPSAYLI